jgi:hypothetical protein
MNSNNFGMVKDESPPAQKGSPCNLSDLMQQADKEIKMYEGMSDAGKAASKSIQKFLSAIPPTSRSKFLAEIGSDEFLKTFASVSSGAAGSIQVKLEHDPNTQLGADANRSKDKIYAVFIAAQSETLKEDYKRFKRKYAATNCFGNAKIPFQTFTSGFQVTSAPRLGDQTIAKFVLCKDDRGDTPLAQQKTREKVVCAIKPEIQTCKLSRILMTFDICNFLGKNVPTACLKLKAVINVLGDKTPSNTVRTILEGFVHASTDTFMDLCTSKIAMQSDSIYASLLAKVPLRSQVSSTLNDLEQKYQQLITAKKWEGVGHVGMDNHNKSALNATANQKDEAQSYAGYVNNKATQGFFKVQRMGQASNLPSLWE